MKKTHGLSKTRFYGVWNDMMMRCYNPNRERYPKYGGRGIVVCERWHLFQNFYDDMFPSYKRGLTIEREDVDGPYALSNCKWILQKDQFYNKTNTVRLTILGETKFVKDWSLISGVKPKTIYERLSKGWNDYDSVFEPVRRQCFSPEELLQIKNQHLSGKSFRSIAKAFNTTHGTIRKFINP